MEYIKQKTYKLPSVIITTNIIFDIILYHSQVNIGHVHKIIHIQQGWIYIFGKDSNQKNLLQIYLFCI